MENPYVGLPEWVPPHPEPFSRGLTAKFGKAPVHSEPVPKVPSLPKSFPTQGVFQPPVIRPSKREDPKPSSRSDRQSWADVLDSDSGSAGEQVAPMTGLRLRTPASEERLSPFTRGQAGLQRALDKQEEAFAALETRSHGNGEVGAKGRARRPSERDQEDALSISRRPKKRKGAKGNPESLPTKAKGRRRWPRLPGHPRAAGRAERQHSRRINRKGGRDLLLFPSRILRVSAFRKGRFPGRS